MPRAQQHFLAFPRGRSSNSAPRSKSEKKPAQRISLRPQAGNVIVFRLDQPAQFSLLLTISIESRGCFLPEIIELEACVCNLSQDLLSSRTSSLARNTA